MSIHKLTAGSGYDYLTRQVAALDATEKGHLERDDLPVQPLPGMITSCRRVSLCTTKLMIN